MKLSQSKKEKSLERGFTLIEVLAAIFIFSLVAGAAVNILISGIRVQRRTLLARTLLDNISFNLEYMSRALRMAKKDDIDIGGVITNCLSGHRANYEITTPRQGIKFRNHRNQCQEFFLENRRLKEERIGLGVNYVNYLTPVGININSFTINQHGWSEADNLQPRVTLILTAEVQGQEITIRTAISQRDLDFPPH